MKAVVFHAIGDFRVEHVPEPAIEQPGDAIVQLTASASCGTDLHFICSTFSGTARVEQVGSDVIEHVLARRLDPSRSCKQSRRPTRLAP